ncbi:MAG: hypothetical protein RL519_1476 [Pseudomonadota bacterium]|jgi:hypothetical protein
MSTIKTGTSIASAAAMLALSTMAQAAAAPAGSTGAAISARDAVHCYGVNKGFSRAFAFLIATSVRAMVYRAFSPRMAPKWGPPKSSTAPLAPYVAPIER